MQQKSGGKIPPSSVGSELKWLALFVVLFTVITYLMLRFIVPLHFNDRIAVMLAGILSGIIWIIVRAASIKRA